MNEEFEHWLFYMDDALLEFQKMVPEPLMNKLDYSIGSLDQLEDWMLKTFDNPNMLLEESNKVIQDRISRYIGETYRKILNAQWSIRVDDPDFAFYGLPIIVEKETQNTIICPHTMSTTTVDRNRGNFLSTILKNNVKKLK